MDTDEYKRVFEVQLRADSKAAYRWQTREGGEYYATGVGGALAGRGADLAIIDDPHSEQDAMSPAALEAAWDWYQGGPRQRLQPGGAIVIVMTRWSTIDLTAKVLKMQSQDPKADKWEVIEFPAIFSVPPEQLEKHPEGFRPLWSEYWNIDELMATKASMGISKWNAQYMQNPTADESAIIKKGWWKRWVKDKPPKIEYIMQSYDTAYSKSETADFSAIQTWGVFYPKEDEPAALILLDAKKGRWDFPELKRRALKAYQEYPVDTVLIEAKAAGMPLAQELRAVGIPVQTFTPSRGNDKFVRVNSVSPLFESGQIWAPEASWADEVIEECAAFPVGENDDMVDCMTQALMRFRQGGFVTHPEDVKYDEDEGPPKRRVYY
jgi:predicted phage terminase large subunit-like protein